MARHLGIGGVIPQRTDKQRRHAQQGESPNEGMKLVA